MDTYVEDGRIRVAYVYAWRWPGGLLEVIEGGDVNAVDGVPVRNFRSRKPMVVITGDDGAQDLPLKWWSLKFGQAISDALGKE